jgi:chromosomal replication initiator protein
MAADVAAKVDLLLVDDLHYLARVEARSGQKVLLQVIEHMLTAGKGVVIATAQAVPAMLSLEPALRSRLGRGVVVEIDPPEPALLASIFRRMAGEAQVNVTGNALELLIRLGITTRNARDAWEGALARVNSLGSHPGEPGELGEQETDVETDGMSECSSRRGRDPGPDLRVMTVEHVHPLVFGVSAISKSTLSVSLDTIADRVAAYYDLHLREIRTGSRMREVLFPRQMAMYLMRTETDAPFSSIAAYFGKRDHTTAMHSCRKIEDLVETNGRVRETVLLLRQLIYGEHAHQQAS